WPDRAFRGVCRMVRAAARVRSRYALSHPRASPACRLYRRLVCADPVRMLAPNPCASPPLDRLAGPRSDDRGADAAAAQPIRVLGRERVLEVLDSALLDDVSRRQLLEHPSPAATVPLGST